MIEAKVVADSLARSGVRITTLELKYPRFIHSEFMTHRVFSRNASSSRAIPVERMIDEINRDWARPIEFRQNQRGMQAGEPLSSSTGNRAFKIWAAAKDDAISRAEQLIDLGVHKQYANRLLEPFAHISVVVTATDWANFFALRHHYMAQPEIALLAERMYVAIAQSIPQRLEDGQWHMPYVDDACILESRDWQEENGYEVEDIWLKRSVARCARVSYNNHNGKPSTVEEDLKLYDRLLGAQPIHASPAEHQAMATRDRGIRSGNFRGWIQYRKTLRGENVSKFVPGMFDDRVK